MDDKKIAFAPFHAINQFMLPEYRHKVLQTVLSGADRLSGERKNMLNGLIRKWVQVPGFRNSAMAPAAVKLKGSIAAFEKSPQFVAQTLSCWAEINKDLAEKVYTLLTQRGWEVMPVDADRSKMPGFMTQWHESDHYEVLDEAFKQMYPDVEVTTDDIRLMVVWLSNRLPYDADEGGEEESE